MRLRVPRVKGGKGSIRTGVMRKGRKGGRYVRGEARTREREVEKGKEERTDGREEEQEKGRREKEIV